MGNASSKLIRISTHIASNLLQSRKRSVFSVPSDSSLAHWESARKLIKPVKITIKPMGIAQNAIAATLFQIESVLSIKQLLMTQTVRLGAMEFALNVQKDHI